MQSISHILMLQERVAAGRLALLGSSADLLARRLRVLPALCPGLAGRVARDRGAQVYRYRRVSTVSQRQQTKWVVFGASTAMLAVVVVALPIVLFPALVQSSWIYHMCYCRPLPATATQHPDDD